MAYSPKCVEYAFSEVDIPALCVAPSLCGRNSYVESKGSWPCLHKTLSGAGRWNRANFAITEFSEVCSQKWSPGIFTNCAKVIASHLRRPAFSRGGENAGELGGVL